MVYLTSQRFGRPQGASGVQVNSLVSPSNIGQSYIGTVGMMGIAKRGPMDVWVRCSNFADYLRMYGDPSDRYWAIYSDMISQLPDAVDDFFRVAGADSQFQLMRIGGDGKAKKATSSSKNRFNTTVLSHQVGSPGRWAGYDYDSDFAAIIVSTQRSITFVLPGVEKNELIGGSVIVSSQTGQRFPIVSNTAANPVSGEVVITISPQFDLVSEGVSGPATLTGLATYNRLINLTGTVTILELEDLTGTVTIGEENPLVIVGDGTAFTSELTVGQSFYYLNEARTITSITSDTTLTIESSFVGQAGSGLTVQRSNLTLAGTGSAFTTELAVGDKLLLDYEGVTYTRTVSAIADDETLTLSSGFPFDVTDTQIQTENYWVEGELTADYGNELAVGNYIIDPNRSGSSIKVVEIDAVASPERFKVEEQFSADFSNAQITKQNQLARVSLRTPVNQGLALEYRPGNRYPLTHTRIDVYFNGSVVMTVGDCSLDPNDEQGLYIEDVLSESGDNIAYTAPDGTTYYNWLDPQGINNFIGEYTTASSNDVRPWNGTGEILELTPTRIYTVAEFDYDAVQNNWLYPNIYDNPQSRIRTQMAVEPITLQGTISSLGENVTGTATNFLSVFQQGDFLYDPNTNSVREVTQVLSETSLKIKTAFDTNIPADTEGKRAGYLAIDQGLDLSLSTEVGVWFVASFPEYFKGGYDGDFSALNPFWYTKHANIDNSPIETASRGKNQGMWRWAAPGVSDPTIQRLLIAYTDQIPHLFRAEIPGYIKNASQVVSYLERDLGLGNHLELAFPSYGYYANTVGGGRRLRTLAGEILGRETQILNSQLPRSFHRATAGMDATLNGVLDLPVELSPQEEAILNNSNIQQIVKRGGVPVIWGVKHPTRNADYEYITTLRLQLAHINDFLESTTIQALMFKPNDTDVANQLFSLLDDYAREQYRIGAYSNTLAIESAYDLKLGAFSEAVSGANSQSQRDRLAAIFNEGALVIQLTYVDTPPVDQIDVAVGSMRTIFLSRNGATAI